MYTYIHTDSVTIHFKLNVSKMPYFAMWLLNYNTKLVIPRNNLKLNFT